MKMITLIWFYITSVGCFILIPWSVKEYCTVFLCLYSMFYLYFNRRINRTSKHFICIEECLLTHSCGSPRQSTFLIPARKTVHLYNDMDRLGFPNDQAGKRWCWIYRVGRIKGIRHLNKLTYRATFIRQPCTIVLTVKFSVNICHVCINTQEQLLSVTCVWKI